MAAPARLNDLAERKRLLIAEAGLHRAVMDMEQARLQAAFELARAQVRTHRWWLLGGALIAGVLLVRTGGGPARWIPLAASAWRMARNVRPR